MEFLKIFIGAYILDLAVGDPEYRLHPIRVIGDMILYLEKKFYRKKHKKICGFFLLIVSITVVFVVTYLIAKSSKILEMILLYTTFATRCLADSGNGVYNILKNSNLKEAKKHLSYLVTRDTVDMSKEEISKSTIETMSENSVDGIISPMFFAFIGSFITIDGVYLTLPFAMTYKCVNTLDSMVGYKNDKYYDFGYFSAKFDDLLNFIPARLTGGVIVPIASFLLSYNWKGAWRIFLRDRKKHESPNSACAEAAFAGALDIYFGGKTIYFGESVEKEIIGDKTLDVEVEHIRRAKILLYGVSVVGFVIIIMLKTIILKM